MEIMKCNTDYLLNFDWRNIYKNMPAIKAKRLIDAMPIKDFLVEMKIELTDIENMDRLRVDSWIESGYLCFAFKKEVS